MLLPKFDYHEPADVAEACELMAEFGEKARPLAGGTDLMVNMKKKIFAPEHLVSLSRIESLTRIDESKSMINIGACFTVIDLVESDLIKEKLSALRTGARALGSILVRNRATIGGNIGSARPAADLLPPLMAYGANVVLESKEGQREFLLEEFILGPGQTAIKPNEILTEIRVPIPPAQAGAGYINLGNRKSQEINIINVASYLALDNTNGTIKNVRIVMGAVGPTPLRATSAEELLMGKMPDEELFAEAGELAKADSAPIDDFRGSAEFRRAMVGVLTKRTLAIAYEEATGH
jgi:CO/xanthine dehydrogenase FAD-binding subunit